MLWRVFLFATMFFSSEIAFTKHSNRHAWSKRGQHFRLLLLMHRLTTLMTELFTDLSTDCGNMHQRLFTSGPKGRGFESHHFDTNSCLAVCRAGFLLLKMRLNKRCCLLSRICFHVLACLSPCLLSFSASASSRSNSSCICLDASATIRSRSSMGWRSGS